MRIKITFRYELGFLEISAETQQYKEKIPCIICLEKRMLGKPRIYSIGINKDRILDQLKADEMDLEKYFFIDPFSMEMFDDRIIGLIIKYYCAIIHRTEFPKRWNLRYMYGIDHYCINFYLPYDGLYLERVRKQLQKVSGKKLISVVASSI